MAESIFHGRFSPYRIGAKSLQKEAIGQNYFFRPTETEGLTIWENSIYLLQYTWELYKEYMGKPLNKIIIVTSLGIIVLATPEESFAGAVKTSRDPHYVDVGIIAIIESGDNPIAYNPFEQAYGAHQIRQAALTDYNTKGPGRARPLSLRDMYDDFLSEHVADWYINVQIPKYIHHYHIKDEVNARIVAYNAGIRALKTKHIPPMTRAYINVYHELLNKKEEGANGT